MKIILEPVVLTVRLFNNEEAEYGDPYDGVMTVHKFGSDAVITAWHGSITPLGYKRLVDAMLEMGVTTVRAERNGKERVWNLLDPLAVGGC